MKYAWSLATILLLFCWSMMAQAQKSAETAQQGQAVPVEGCLGGSTGHYQVLTKDGKNMQIDSKDPKLAKLVGHTVQATGIQNPGTTTTTNATNEVPNGATNTGAELTLTATDVTDISATCEQGTTKAKPQ